MNCYLKAPAILQKLQVKLKWLDTINCLAFKQLKFRDRHLLSVTWGNTKATSWVAPIAQLHQWLTDARGQYAQSKFIIMLSQNILSSYSLLHDLLNQGYSSVFNSDAYSFPCLNLSMNLLIGHHLHVRWLKIAGHIYKYIEISLKTTIGTKTNSKMPL